MGINTGSNPITGVYVGAQRATGVYVGDVKVWPAGKPVEQIALDNSTGAQRAFRSLLTKYGEAYKTVSEVPFDIELTGVGSTTSMFRDCVALVSAPKIDTSNVLFMDYMFNGCSALTHVPPLDISRVNTCAYMFQNCSSLTDGNVHLMSKNGSKPYNRSQMISRSGLTREPFFLSDGTPF